MTSPSIDSPAAPSRRDAPRYRCFVKGTDQETGEPRHSAAWIAARRGRFEVYDDRVCLGNWTIPIESIQEAILYETRGGLVTAPVLHLRTADRQYQFGFNPWARVAEHLPFPVERRQAQMGMSAFSLVLRLALAGYLVFYLVQRLRG